MPLARTGAEFGCNALGVFHREYWRNRDQETRLMAILTNLENARADDGLEDDARREYPAGDPDENDPALAAAGFGRETPSPSLGRVDSREQSGHGGVDSKDTGTKMDAARTGLLEVVYFELVEAAFGSDKQGEGAR